MPVYDNLQYLKIKRPLPDFVQYDDNGIPFIETDKIDISDINNGKWLISLNNVSSKDDLAYRKIVHSFKDDDVLERSYNHPFKYLERVANYYAVSSFDFSMDTEMKFAMVYLSIFKNRWSGVFAQANGKKVIPTVGWTSPEFDDICFSGLRNGSTFLISTLGTKNSDSISAFLRGYKELRKRFPKSKLICVGNKIEGMDSDVCMVNYADSFGSWNRRRKFWQPSLINWNGELSDERSI